MSDPVLMEVPARPGHVSAVCRYEEVGGVRFVLVREIVLASYEVADRNAERTIWVQLHRAGHATQGQIAQAIGVGLRTFNGWMRHYRDQGVSGLMTQPLPGKQANADKAELIRRYRAAGHKITDIAVLAKVSRATVNRVLGRDRAVAELVLEVTAAKTLPVPVTAPTPIAVAATPLTATIPVAATPPALSEAVPSAAPAPTAAVPAPAELTTSTPGVNPLDRSADRALAVMGLLEDAEPVFAPGTNLPWVGAFLALALLGQEPLLPVAQKVFHSLGKAFYGLRTTLVTLVLLALLRIKRPEQLRQWEAGALGRVLGLDRVLEVKTLRRKLHQLSHQDQGVPFLEALAQARVQGLQAPPRLVYVDGHVGVYTGQYKIGEVYSTRDKCVVKGVTQTWVNLPGRAPLFCVTSEFNEGLVAVLPAVLAQATKVCGAKALTAVFDRGGHSGLGFEQLRQVGHHLITYRRGTFEPWPLTRFVKTPTTIGGRQYAYAPAEEWVELPVYEAAAPASGQRGAPRKRDTGRRVKVREIRVVRADEGQTAVLVSDPDLPAVEACAVLFGRWGAQENIFKYLLAEYDLDATVEYGEQELSATLTHPNPEYVRRQKQIATLVKQRNRRLGQLGVKLLVEPVPEEQIPALLSQWSQQPAGKKALTLHQDIERLRTELATLPARVTAQSNGFHQLKTDLKLLTIGLKLSAYYVETRLVDMMAPFYANHAKEGRKLIVAALQSPGSIRLQPGQIRVQLARQSAPCRTRAIGKLCEVLNQLHPKYPGTDLQIVFEPPVE